MNLIPNIPAAAAGDLIFIGGTGPVDGHGKPVAPGDAARQTEAIIERLARILRANGLDLAHLVFVTVYIAEAGHYAAMNEAYARCMPAPFPARKCLVTAMFEPGRVVEMTAIASRGQRQLLNIPD